MSRDAAMRDVETAWRPFLR